MAIIRDMGFVKQKNITQGNDKINASDRKLIIDASLSKWEEAMVIDIARTYNIPVNVVLDIGMTFMVNELQASVSQEPCVFNSIVSHVNKHDDE